jgi:hypothetical protein
VSAIIKVAIGGLPVEVEVENVVEAGPLAMLQLNRAQANREANERLATELRNLVFYIRGELLA